MLLDAPKEGPPELRQFHGIVAYHLGFSLERLGRDAQAIEALRRSAALLPAYRDGPARLAALEARAP